MGMVCVLVATALVASGCRYTSDLRLPDHQAESSQVLWSDGSLLTTLHGVEDRQPVTLAAMAPSLPKAVVAIEDQRFFDHDGVDARGVVRALTRDVQEGNLDQGGSTITQQYVRAVMLGPEKDLERKLREAVMAVQLEQRYSKRTILERYLNTIYFGNGAHGGRRRRYRYFMSATRPRPRPDPRCWRASSSAAGLRPLSGIQDSRSGAGTRCSSVCVRSGVLPPTRSRPRLLLRSQWLRHSGPPLPRTSSTG